MSITDNMLAGAMIACITLAASGAVHAQTINQNSKINVSAVVRIGDNQDTTVNQTGALNFGVVAQRGNNVTSTSNQSGYLNGVYVNQSGGTATANVSQSATFANYSTVNQGWSFSRR